MCARHDYKKVSHGFVLASYTVGYIVFELRFINDNIVASAMLHPIKLQNGLIRLADMATTKAWQAPKIDQAEVEAAKRFSSKEHMRTKGEIKSTLDSLISSDKATTVKGQLTDRKSRRPLPEPLKKVGQIAMLMGKCAHLSPHKKRRTSKRRWPIFSPFWIA